MATYNRQDYRTALPQLEKRIDALENRVKYKNTFTTDQVIKEEITISANSISNNIDLDIDKDGYVPIAIRGFASFNSSVNGVNGSFVTPYYLYMRMVSGKRYVTFRLRNHHPSNSAKIDFYVWIIYAKE